jgi:quinol monooxygenase YgiN
VQPGALVSYWKTKNMIKRIVKLTFKPENAEEFKAIFKSNWQKIKGFEGCEHVELLQDENNPAIFFTFSLWKDAESIENYRNSELFEGVWASAKKLFDDKPEAWTVKELNFN